MSDVIKRQGKTFEDILQKTKDGVEFWSARELQKVLEYTSWDKFKVVIEKSIKACENSGNPVSDYFSQVGKIVRTGLGVERHVLDYDYRLTRYACYLIVQNADSSKPILPFKLPEPKNEEKICQIK